MPQAHSHEFLIIALQNADPDSCCRGQLFIRPCVLPIYPSLAFCTNFYCTHLWWSYSKETLRKTTVAYNNSLRFLLGYQRFCSASGMFVECNLDNFATIRRRYIYNFMCRTRTSSNCIIQTLVKHQCYVATPSVMEWGRSLYAGERLETFQ